MGHCAEIVNGKVTRVIRIDSSEVGNIEKWCEETYGGTWKRTSYNTFAGQHGQGGQPLRKNFAGVGFDFDEGRDAFIPPKRHDSWKLNETKGLYEAPKNRPTDGKDYTWDEASLSWKLLN